MTTPIQDRLLAQLTRLRLVRVRELLDTTPVEGIRPQGRGTGPRSLAATDA